jgi:hypothetical protein
MSDRYILEGKTPVLCNDLMAWARWFEKAERHVANETRGDVQVSTVFLGLDHAFGGSVPLLFETMIFGGKHDEYQDRCSTWDEAEQMHKRACELAFRD